MIVHAAVVAGLLAIVAARGERGWAPSFIAVTTTSDAPGAIAPPPLVEVTEDARVDDAAATIEFRTAGDREQDVAHAQAPTAAPNPDARAGAAARSSGSGPGAPTLVTDRADAATLRVQPYDAPHGYQMQRIASAATRESREQVRATPHPGSTPWLASHEGRGHGREHADRQAISSTARRRDESDRAPPRDATRSAAGFARPVVQANPAATDAAEPSERVSDRVDQALVSDEKQPQKLELSRPNSPGSQLRGGGDGALGYAPAGRGAATVPTGAPALPDGRELAMATFQRTYDMYVARVKQKVDPLWEFPRELAIKMEQGDVLIGFVIRKDGTVRDVRVLKGSGFPSFDKNVLNAIKKASPFPPLPETLGSELRVTAPFEGSNPAIR